MTDAATNALFLVRLTTTTDWTRENGKPAIVEYIALSKAGKAMRKAKATQAGRFTAVDAQEVRGRVDATIQAQLARTTSGGQVTLVEVVSA